MACSSFEGGGLGAGFFELVEVVGGEVVEGLAGAAGPGDFYCGDHGGIAEAEAGAEVALRQVATAAGDFADLVYTTCGDFDSGAEGIAVGFCADQCEIHEMIFMECVVVQKSGWIAIVGDDHVDVAVVVEIGERDTAGGPRGKRVEAALRGDFGEFAAHLVMEQRVVLFVERAGGDLLDLGIDVAVADEYVEPTVVVVVEKATAKAEDLFRGERDAGLVADFVEVSLA